MFVFHFRRTARARFGGMEFRIETLGPSEIDRVRDAVLALHRHEVAVQPKLGSAPARDDVAYWEHYRSRFAERYAAGNGLFYAAVDDSGAALGFIYAIERDGLDGYENSAKMGYVEEIAVLDSARKFGVGRALMDAARNEFRRRGYSHFELSSVPGNESARAFYARLGMQPAAVLMIGDV